MWLHFAHFLPLRFSHPTWGCVWDNLLSASICPRIIIDAYLPWCPPYSPVPSFTSEAQFLAPYVLTFWPIFLSFFLPSIWLLAFSLDATDDICAQRFQPLPLICLISPGFDEILLSSRSCLICFERPEFIFCHAWRGMPRDFRRLILADFTVFRSVNFSPLTDLSAAFRLSLRMFSTASYFASFILIWICATEIHFELCSLLLMCLPFFLIAFILWGFIFLSSPAQAFYFLVSVPLASRCSSCLPATICEDSLLSIFSAFVSLRLRLFICL